MTGFIDPWTGLPMKRRLPDTGELRSLIADSVDRVYSEPATASYAASMERVEDVIGSVLSELATCVVNVTQTTFCKIVLPSDELGFEPRAIAFANGLGRMHRMPDPIYVQRIYYRAQHTEQPLLISRWQDSLSLDEGRTLRYHGVHDLYIVPFRSAEGSTTGMLVVGEQERRLHDGQRRLAELMTRFVNARIQQVTQPEKHNSVLDSVMLLSKAVQHYDDSISRHSLTMVQLAEQLAERLGCLGSEVKSIGLAALLHDLGKIGLPTSLLQKPRPLSEEEWEIMKRHPGIGAQIVLSVTGLGGVATIIQCHHERYDGTGYPNGLKEMQIPLGARILAVVDAFEAITSGRIYRKPLTVDAALEEIQRCKGTQFDPHVVDAFVALIHERGYNANQGE